MIQSSFKFCSLGMLLELLAESTKQILEDTYYRIDAGVIQDKRNMVKLLEKAIVDKRATENL